MTADKHNGITQLEYNVIHLTDHQGNVRMVASAGGAVEETNHYYPFGALFGESAGGGRQHYKYNGKELDRLLALDWYDYGARWYDPVLARWHAIDPLANENPSVSPYAYCDNNAVNKIDPDGMDDYYTSNGVYLGTNKSTSDYIYITDKYTKTDIGYIIPINSRTRLDKANLKAEAYSKIFTKTLKLGGVDTRTLNDGKIQVTVWESSPNGVKESTNYTDKSSLNGDALAVTDSDHSNGAIITAFVWPEYTEERKVFITRSNILSCLETHERKGHYVKNYKHVKNKPDQTYKDQKNDPVWKKVTPFYKNYIEDIIKYYGYE